jgi:hypothetical protein
MTRWTQRALKYVAIQLLCVLGTDDMLQTVRRDNCRLVQTVIETCLHKMLIDRDVKGAEECVLLGIKYPSSTSIDITGQLHQTNHI